MGTVLMSELITATTFDDLHYKLIRMLFEIGSVYVIDEGSYVGHKRLEYDFISFQVKYPSRRPLAPMMPVGCSPVTTDEKINEYYNKYLMYPDVAENEEYTYGEYIFDQVPKVVDLLKRSPGTNQATMTIGGKESLDQKHPPCLRLIDCNLKGGKLNFFVYFRSWDLWCGLPENLGGLQLLKEDMANAIGVEDGQMFGCSKGLHLYDFCWPIALDRMKGQLPSWSILSEAEVKLGEGWMKQNEGCENPNGV